MKVPREEESLCGRTDGWTPGIHYFEDRVISAEVLRDTSHSGPLSEKSLQIMLNFAAKSC